jgi:hypothetical protein
MPENNEYKHEVTFPDLASQTLEALAYSDDLQCYFEKFPDVEGTEEYLDKVLHIRDVLEKFQGHIESIVSFLEG